MVLTFKRTILLSLTLAIITCFILLGFYGFKKDSCSTQIV